MVWGKVSSMATSFLFKAPAAGATATASFSALKTPIKIALGSAAAFFTLKGVEPHLFSGAKKGSFEAMGMYNPIQQSLANMNILGPAASIAGQRSDMIRALAPNAPFQMQAALANPQRMMMGMGMGMGMGMWGMGY
jgi:hypothetical protein